MAVSIGEVATKVVGGAAVVVGGAAVVVGGAAVVVGGAAVVVGGAVVVVGGAVVVVGEEGSNPLGFCKAQPVSTVGTVGLTWLSNKVGVPLKVWAPGDTALGCPSASVAASDSLLFQGAASVLCSTKSIHKYQSHTQWHSHLFSDHVHFRPGRHRALLPRKASTQPQAW